MALKFLLYIDPSLYKKYEVGRLVLLCIYVDDLILKGDTKKAYLTRKSNGMKYPISHNEEKSKYSLGIEIVKKNECITLQRKFDLLC